VHIPESRSVVPTTETIHEPDGSIVRRVTLDDGTEHDFDVFEDGVDVPEHAYRGDGEPPAEATAALEEFLAEYHDVDTGDDTATDDGAVESAVDDAPESYQ